MNFRILVALAGATAAVLGTGCAQQPARNSPSNAYLASNYTPKQILQMARDQGFRPVTRDGKTLYCRRETPIGTNLPETRCVDETQLRFMVLRAQRQQQALEEGQPMIGQPPGN